MYVYWKCFLFFQEAALKTLGAEGLFLFSSLDVDHDLYLSPEEFKPVAEKLTGSLVHVAAPTRCDIDAAFQFNDNEKNPGMFLTSVVFVSCLKASLLLRSSKRSSSLTRTERSSRFTRPCNRSCSTP